MTTPRDIARALGGDVNGNGALVPGPGHSSTDRSLSVTLRPDAPDGFLVFSHAGDDPIACRDHVRGVLGLPAWSPGQNGQADGRAPRVAAAPRPAPPSDDAEKAAEKTAKALRIFETAEHDHPVLQAYLRGRGVELPPGALGDTVRFHARCPWGPGQTVAAMVCLVRGVAGTADEPEGPPLAIHRTRLVDDDGKLLLHGKDRKRALGPIGKGVIKLTRDEDVTTCLGVAEGLESALSLRNLPDFGPSPVWATINASGLESFPVLSGIETLWIAVDNDEAGLKAAQACADRWQDAGRETFRIVPTDTGADLADLQPVEAGHE
jgi:putative DNA primase/helicase